MVVYMRLQIGDYVEGYRMEKYALEIKYTRGWVVSVNYEHDRLSHVFINEDIPYMLGKYWPDPKDEEQEYDLKCVWHDDSMLLVVRDPRYQVRKVKRQEKWWSRYFRDSEKIDIKADKTKELPYYIDRSMFKIGGVAKVFTLDGVLQVPNSSYTSEITDIKYENQPIKKMLDYIEKYTVRPRRILLVDVDYEKDIYEELEGKVSNQILDLFDKEKIKRAPTFESKACLVDDIASGLDKGDDLLLIDNDVRIIEEIQNNRLFPKQAPNLKAIHVSAFMDMIL